MCDLGPVVGVFAFLCVFLFSLGAGFVAFITTSWWIGVILPVVGLFLGLIAAVLAEYDAP